MSKKAAAVRTPAKKHVGEWTDITKIKPWARNPRKNDAAVPKVAESIKRFGFASPIVVRKANNEIIAGHTRYRAAQSLGLKKVPVVFVDMSEEDAHAYALADNRLNEIAEWDNTELYKLITEMPAEDVQIAGWAQKDLDDLTKLLQAEGVLPKPEVVEDEVPSLPKDPVTKMGDVWLLGRHRVVCGDSRDANYLAKAQGDLGPVDLVFTDPPYGVSYVSADGKPVHNDDLEGLEQLVRTALKNAAAMCRPGAVWYVCAPPGPQFYTFATVLRDLEIWRQTIAWVKDSLVLGHSDFHYQHESILYGWTPDGPHQAPPDRKQTSVWSYPKPSRSEEHPTMKPVALVANGVELSSKKGNVILDPFLGSGTTLIVAEQLERTCIGVEFGPEYVDVIVERWQQLTGQKAKRAR